MTVEQNKALVRRFFEEIVNAQRLEVADEIFAYCAGTMRHSKSQKGAR